MNKNGEVEYIFWLSALRDFSVSFLPKNIRYKCIITKKNIKVIPVENGLGEKLEIDMSLIQECKFIDNGSYPVHHVEVSLYERRIILAPTNPFDPNHLLSGNRMEASAMTKIIKAFRLNIDPQVDPNPYIRQLAMKNNFKQFGSFAQLVKDELARLEGLNQNWDANISPWTYNELYGDKLLYLKTLGKIFAFVILLAIAGTGIILLIAYVLDTLNII